MTRTEIEIKKQISIIFENKLYRRVKDSLALTWIQKFYKSRVFLNFQDLLNLSEKFLGKI